MLAALAYLVASVFVTVLLYFSRKQKHETRDGIEVFRYPTLLLTVILLMTPVYGAGATFIYAVSPDKPVGWELVLFSGFFVGLMVLNTFAYLYLRSFVVEVSEQGIRANWFGRSRVVPFGDIRVVQIAHSARGGADLSLLGDGGRKLLKVGGSIEDFDSLVWLLKRQAAKTGAAVKE